jgi:Fuc2NAc and GlcNAc transferase
MNLAGVVAVGLSVAAAVALAWLLTCVARSRAIALRMLDVPNARSSHGTPMPRGGGLAVAGTATVGFVVLATSNQLEVSLLSALLGGIPIAVIGFADDLRPVRAFVRLAVHATAALWAIGWLGGLRELPVGGWVLPLGVAGYAVSALAIIWSVNLFNFMDGIDGIAGSEGAFVAWAASALMISMGASSGIAAAALLLGAACIGFLWWNWPPAKIFMGDVGSGYLGYVMAVLALAAARDNPEALWVWLILGGVFFVDATVTLIRRLIRGERVYEAHRTHAYQWLARRWGSHGRVTVAVLLTNVFWLLPCATFATLRPSLAAVTTLVALAPLVAIAIVAGSGRPEQPDRATT